MGFPSPLDALDFCDTCWNRPPKVETLAVLGRRLAAVASNLSPLFAPPTRASRIRRSDARRSRAASTSCARRAADMRSRPSRRPRSIRRRGS
jgi:hypothetical protein